LTLANTKVLLEKQKSNYASESKFPISSATSQDRAKPQPLNRGGIYPKSPATASDSIAIAIPRKQSHSSD
jgi:hypothetical protein